MNKCDMNSLGYLRFIRKKYSLDNKSIGELTSGIFEYLKTVNEIPGLDENVSLNPVRFNSVSRKTNTTSAELFEFFRGKKLVFVNDIITQFPSLNTKVSDGNHGRLFSDRIKNLKFKKLITSPSRGVYNFAD